MHIEKWKKLKIILLYKYFLHKIKNADYFFYSC